MDTFRKSKQIVIPHSGLAKEVIIVEWLIEHGATVVAGTPLVIYESEKTEIEMDSPCDGELEIIVGASDDEVPAGTIIGNIIEPL